jgi:hypothetical protein
MANAPLPEQDGEGYKGDLRFRKSRIFFQAGIDTLAAKQPDGQIRRAGRRGAARYRRTANSTTLRESEKIKFTVTAIQVVEP